MDVVEAIDAWIDETIDDLSDDELETILEILDAVSDSRFANTEAIDVYDDDIDMLVDLVGGDSDARAHTDLVLRRALFGELDASNDDSNTMVDEADPDPDGDGDGEGDTAGDGIDDVADDGIYLEADTEEDDTDLTDDGPAELERVSSHHDGRDETDEPDTEPDATEPDAPEPDATDRDETEPDDTDRDETEPDATGLDDTDRDETEPDATGLDDTQPDATGLDDTQPPDTELLDAALGEPVLDDLEDPSYELNDGVDTEPGSDDELDDEFDDLAKFFAENDVDEAQGESGRETDKSEDRNLHDGDLNDLDDLDLELDDAQTGDTDAEDRSMDSDAVFLGDLFSAQTADSNDIAIQTAHDDFLADVASASATAELKRPVSAAPLRPFDALGPAFLPQEPAPRPPGRSKRGARIGQIALPVFMLVGLAAFTFGMLQLINSLDESEAELAIAPETTTAPTPEPTNDLPAAVATEAPASTQPADATGAPTPAPEPTREPRIAIRLVTGDVMVATYLEPGAPPELDVVYDGTSDEAMPARHIAWLADDLGVIDDDGNVFVVDLDQGASEPSMIYEATGGLAEAVEIATVGDLLAVRTIEGNINLTPLAERADPDILRVAWDGAEEGALAVNISSTGDLVPFVLDSGDARMIQTGDDDSIVNLWSADPQPPAYNVSATAQGVLLGIGEGTISRYLIGDVIGDRMESIWDPPPQDEGQDEDQNEAQDEADEDEPPEQAEDEDEDQGQLPAAGYSQVGDQVAIVLIDGAIILVDASGEVTSIWDPAVTETRAFTAAGDGNYVVLLLETGSIIRVPLDTEKFIESIWDITDETLAPANQLAVEPLN